MTYYDDLLTLCRVYVFFVHENGSFCQNKLLILCHAKIHLSLASPFSRDRFRRPTYISLYTKNSSSKLISLLKIIPEMKKTKRDSRQKQNFMPSTETRYSSGGEKRHHCRSPLILVYNVRLKS